MATIEIQSHLPVDVPQKAVREFLELARAVDTGNPDPAQVAKLRRLLDEHPALARQGGDLCRITADMLIKRSFSHQGSMRFSIERQLETMRQSLGYVEGVEPDGMLIEHILMCWLRLHDVEARLEMVLHDNSSFEVREHFEKRLNAAQRRYLRAVETLARVRKLAQRTPTLNVNIANQQVVAN